MPKYSIIVPVYNRPDEVDELLESLTYQTVKDFDVIIVEDGSEDSCKHIVDNYAPDMDIDYFFKENTGQGFSRNYASERASGDWLVFFDSDCVIPSDYIENLSELVDSKSADAFCGPDSAGPDFSLLQKAISYSMTSFLTTGGIRGGKKKVDSEAHLRSYNLVMNKQVFQKLEGFAQTNMGEDMEISNRFNKSGYRAIISQNLKVFHKRRNTLVSFFKQVFSFGRTRIQLKRRYGIPIKLPHFFPFAFILGFTLAMVGLLFYPDYANLLVYAYAGYFLLILVHSTFYHLSVAVGFLTIAAVFIQHSAYGLGFIKEVLMPERT